MNAKLWVLEQSIHLQYQGCRRCKLFQANSKYPVVGNLPRWWSMFSYEYQRNVDRSIVCPSFVLRTDTTYLRSMTCCDLKLRIIRLIPFLSILRRSADKLGLLINVKKIPWPRFLRPDIWVKTKMCFISIKKQNLQKVLSFYFYTSIESFSFHLPNHLK